MMLAWSFPARTVDEIGRLLRALGKHRYVREVDHRIHWTVVRALAESPRFAALDGELDALRRRRADLDLGSRDPDLWLPATLDDVMAALGAFWDPERRAERNGERLLEVLESGGFSLPEHDPFDGSPEEPPHPELVLLDWELLPVDELDTERHAGALAAMAEAEEEVDPSAAFYQEGPSLSALELICGAPQGVLLCEELLIWSDGPYAYSDYVFRGAARAARLVDPPVGYREL